MTPLPELPPNLDPACVSCGSVSALTSQLTTGIAGQAAQVQGALAGQIQGAVGSQVAQLQTLTNQINAADAATRAVIEAAISEDFINQLLAKYTPVGGVADIKCVADELTKVYDKLNNANELTINLVQGPQISLGSAIESLIPTIPVPTIPSPGEIKEYIVELIERKKKEQQEAILKLQRKDAEASDKSFANV